MEIEPLCKSGNSRHVATGMDLYYWRDTLCASECHSKVLVKPQMAVLSAKETPKHQLYNLEVLIQTSILLAPRVTGNDFQRLISEWDLTRLKAK